MLLATGLFALLFALLWAAYLVVLPAGWRAARHVWAAVSRALLRRPRVAAWYERGSARVKPLHPYLPLLVIVLAGFVAAALTGATFLELAEQVRDRSAALRTVDYTVWERARSLRTPGATAFFVFWTMLGTPPGLGAVVGGVAALLALRGRRRLPLFLVLTCLGGWALNHALKVVFARARPDLTLAVRSSSGYSFPSGHAMGSVVALGALGYVVMRLTPSRYVRSATLAFASGMAAAISLSRVYLGVHWMSDIVAGMAAGLVWLAACVVAYEVSRRVRIMRARPRPAD